MSYIKILTQGYYEDLRKLNINCQTCAGGLHIARCRLSNLNIDALAALLERIVILQHPVYGHSPKLADMALELRELQNIKNLENFLQENNSLHLEGYATFRMHEYRSKLDITMYCLIKKLKLTDSLLP